MGTRPSEVSAISADTSSICRGIGKVEANSGREIGRFPYWTSLRQHFDPDAPFFAPGNIERELLAKQIMDARENQ
ncbi:hypothetical protein Vadar_017322 [Vaccinium darrowii]|uniref:Uncharacterized protein n=1 Tax=Vaccinium darrowii TaxID=229202 RepID=A0ACB7X1C2_9ERIC|nr:hypothetical protein Vadar_017322 [Vaccinium darrowii]